MYETCAKTFFEGTFRCAPGFLVCARLTACVRTHMHSLKGTLLAAHIRFKVFIIAQAGLSPKYFRDPICPHHSAASIWPRSCCVWPELFVLRMKTILANTDHFLPLGLSCALFFSPLYVFPFFLVLFLHLSFQSTPISSIVACSHWKRYRRATAVSRIRIFVYLMT